MGMQLREIALKEVALMEFAYGDLYRFDGGLFELTIPINSPIHKELLKSLALKGIRKLYIDVEDYFKITDNIKDKLIKATRSLSIGDAPSNARKHITLMSLHLQSLYTNPLNDEYLDVQFKGAQNLGKFLQVNKELTKLMYLELKKQKHHYVISQPILSSVLMIGYLNFIKVFQDKDVENLFITSFVKDIGMSFIPHEKFEKSDLDKDEKSLFHKHADSSQQILSGRTSLSRNYLSIIKNHHFLNKQIDDIQNGLPITTTGHDQLMGFETMVVSIFDILVAMTEDRPYRESKNLFDSLELIKKLMSQEYPHEFKALVLYLRNFFIK